MDKNLRFGRVAMLNATRLGADIRIDEELDLYCKSFGLRANWDILSGSTWTLAVIFVRTRFCA